MRWNTINSDKLKKAATLQREEKGYIDTDVLKESITSGLTALSRDYKSDARNRRLKAIRDGIHIPAVADLRKGHSIVDLGLGNPKDDPRLGRPDTDLSIDPVMRPIDPKEKKILYKGRPDFGRLEYLKTRVHKIPEDRFYFAETSSWFYGWRLKDTYLSCKAHGPEHGRVWHLAREKSRSGPAPDPIHYKSAQRLSNCTV
uniref:Sperm microtubule inner protein 1 C-terminal domain-containing protein n=1 Tax=Heliothis virescens TaxID=7102 RepID=A0A2A4K2W3_HELVI